MRIIKLIIIMQRQQQNPNEQRIPISSTPNSISPSNKQPLDNKYIVPIKISFRKPISSLQNQEHDSNKQKNDSIYHSQKMDIGERQSNYKIFNINNSKISINTNPQLFKSNQHNINAQEYSEKVNEMRNDGKEETSNGSIRYGSIKKNIGNSNKNGNNIKEEYGKEKKINHLSGHGLIANILPSEQYSIGNNSEVQSQQLRPGKQFIRNKYFTPDDKMNKSKNKDNQTKYSKTNNEANEKNGQGKQKNGQRTIPVKDFLQHKEDYKNQLLKRPTYNNYQQVNIGIENDRKNMRNTATIINKQILLDEYFSNNDNLRKYMNQKPKEKERILSDNHMYGYNKSYNDFQINKTVKGKTDRELQKQQLDKYYENQSNADDDQDYIEGQSLHFNNKYTNFHPKQINSMHQNNYDEEAEEISPKIALKHYKQDVTQPQMKNIHMNQIQMSKNESCQSSEFQNSANLSKSKYGPGGIQTLQFNPQKEKFIIVDSKETQRNNPMHNSLQHFCEDFQMPIPYPVPTSSTSPQQLVEIAKQNFKLFRCFINDQTLINVKKYKNCVHFSISNEENILWHYDTGKFYFGGWKGLANGQGQKYGNGFEYMPDRYKFKGHFVSGKRSGYGVLINFDGSAYEGQWQFGLKHGEGKQIDSDGIIYEGEWKQGKKSGFGKIISNGKVEFEGIFSKGLKNGYGKQYFQTGDFYDGNYVNHKFEGRGTYYWKSGAVYSGEFKQGKRDGYGVWKSSGKNCDVYEGMYKQDKKDGKGIYKWANGAVYQGMFKQDLKHGEGTIAYENGKVAHLIWYKGQVEKKVQSTQIDDQEEEKLINKITSQKKLLSAGKRSSSNFLIKNRPTSLSARGLHSQRSESNHSGSAPRTMPFHNRTIKKPIKQHENNDNEKVIRLKIQKINNNNFEMGIVKEMKKKRETNKRGSLPKDRPYKGIQISSNINFD